MRKKKKKKEKKKERRKVPQTQAHQAKWNEWLAYPHYALTAKRKGRTKDKGGGGKSARLAARKKRGGEKEKILKVTYPSLGSRMRSCLSLAALCFASRGSICRWPWSSRLGLIGRLKPSGTLLTQHRNVYHFNIFLPTWRIFTSVPVPPFFLLVPFKDGRWVLFPGIR